MDRKKCIKCLCCHEMCPYEAIDIHKTLLAKMVG
ncbi:MAG TPA: 4Fe-4S binding protein [Candidatus Syntrophosphaera thermopropionivorans]|nr:4Fe-4S binding protein [Candidatus Syntrophosphaera thermopropionivorans]